MTVVCPSRVIAVDRPVATSAVNALNTAASISVFALTGWPLLFMTKVPEPLYDKVISPYCADMIGAATRAAGEM